MLVNLFKRNMASKCFKLTSNNVTVELKVYQTEGTRIYFLEPNISPATAGGRLLNIWFKKKIPLPLPFFR